MLDHVFTDAVGAVREVLERSLLERREFEERFLSDMLSGDLIWQTAYWLPGEGSPPRVQADLTLEWPTWSQTTYRLWCLGETIEDPPRMTVELVLRVQRLADPADPLPVTELLPETGDAGPRVALERAGWRTEHLSDGLRSEHSIEVGYEGYFEFDEATLADAEQLDEHFDPLGSWVQSMLIRLGDLNLSFLPPDEEDAHH